ncbi:MAG: lysylphosphatidylglycerol synthase transmembrane domain-containing protein, partial [Anaerolineaceae bacterium]
VVIVASVGFFAALLFFLWMVFDPARAQRVYQFFARLLVPERFRAGVDAFYERFMGGLIFLKSPRDVLMVFVTSVVIWLFETGKYWFVMHAFPFEVSFFALMLMNGLVNLATTIPSAPGYIGTFDLPGIALLTAYGVSKEIASGYTLLLHVALWLPITALGAYFFAREGLKWTQKMSVNDDESLPMTKENA